MFQKELMLINQINKSKECMIYHYRYFKDIGHKFEPYVCNKCHNISMISYELENIAILNAKVLIVDV